MVSHIGNTPLATFLHLERKGQFTLEGLRKHFKKRKPKDVTAFARRVGLLSTGHVKLCFILGLNKLNVAAHAY